MSKIRLYMDEDSTRHSLERALQNRGVDVITVQDVKREGYSDEEELTFESYLDQVPI